jgi:hypothetical protein
MNSKENKKIKEWFSRFLRNSAMNKAENSFPQKNRKSNDSSKQQVLNAGNQSNYSTSLSLHILRFPPSIQADGNIGL